MEIHHSLLSAKNRVFILLEVAGFL